MSSIEGYVEVRVTDERLAALKKVIEKVNIVKNEDNKNRFNKAVYTFFGEAKIVLDEDGYTEWVKTESDGLCFVFDMNILDKSKSIKVYKTGLCDNIFTLYSLMLLSEEKVLLGPKLVTALNYAMRKYNED